MKKIFGINPITELLKSKKNISEIWLLKSKTSKFDHIIELAREQDVPISFKNKDDFNTKGIAGENHQGVLALVIDIKPNRYGLKEFLKQKADIDNQVILILDGITDPRNFGAILRSCDHFNISAVLFAKDHSAPNSPVVYKTSSGAVNYVPQIPVANLARAMEELKKADFWIYGLDIDGEKSISDVNFSGNTAIVLGSEGSGMKRLVKESCDFLIHIPNSGHVDSLNVSVACGIVLYEITK